VVARSKAYILAAWLLGLWVRIPQSMGVCPCVSVLCYPVLVEAFATGWSLVQRSPTVCLNKITKPPVWDGQGPYKDCRATDDEDDFLNQHQSADLIVVHVDGVGLGLSLNCGHQRAYSLCTGWWVWRATVQWYWQGKTEERGEKPVPVPLCPTQIPHELTGHEPKPPWWQAGD
jgi:hypothetical protein